MAGGLLDTKTTAISKLNALTPYMNNGDIESIIEKLYIADTSSDYNEIIKIGMEISNSGLEHISRETYEYITDYLAIAAEASKYKKGSAGDNLSI
jgi:hypothetical protein